MSSSGGNDHLSALIWSGWKRPSEFCRTGMDQPQQCGLRLVSFFQRSFVCEPRDHLHRWATRMTVQIENTFFLNTVTVFYDGMSL